MTRIAAIVVALLLAQGALWADCNPPAGIAALCSGSGSGSSSSSSDSYDSKLGTSLLIVGLGIGLGIALIYVVVKAWQSDSKYALQMPATSKLLAETVRTYPAIAAPRLSDLGTQPEYRWNLYTVRW